MFLRECRAGGVALNACKVLQKRADKQHYVAFFSLEMSVEKLTARLIAIGSGISYYKALTGRISDFELHEFINASTELSELPFIIDDTPAPSISALRTRIRLLYQLYNVKVVFIDYLQLIRGTTKRSNEKSLYWFCGLNVWATRRFRSYFFSGAVSKSRLIISH